MNYTEWETRKVHNRIIKKLIRKKKRDKHFIKKYQNQKTADEMLAEYDMTDHKQRQFIKRQLINSGGAVCAICHRPITDMKDCTIDHIKPRSKGGLTTIENCQLAHFDCNQAKDDWWYD